MSLKIVDPDGDPANFSPLARKQDNGNYPLDTEAAIAWCIAHQARVDFRRSALERTPYVVISLRSGYTANKATFIETVADLQRKLREDYQSSPATLLRAIFSEQGCEEEP